MVKTALDMISTKLGNSVVVLVSLINENQISIGAKVSDNFIAKEINAGKIVQKIASLTGGKGGGRPNFAQGGGKDTTNLDGILLELKDELRKQLS